MTNGMLNKSLLIASMIFFSCFSANALLFAQTEKSTTFSSVEEGDNRAGDFEFKAEVLAGYDSNVFKAPGEAYVDYGKLGYPSIQPSTQGGTFRSLDFEPKYGFDLGGGHSIAGEYLFYGLGHTKPSQQIADVYSHLYGVAYEKSIKGKKRSPQSKIRAGIFKGFKQESYLDRDTGMPATSGTADVSNRYNYKVDLVEAAYELKLRPMKYRVKGSWESRDYENPGAVSEYDYMGRSLEGRIDWKYSKTGSVKFKYGQSVNDYSDRPARNLEGSALKNNPRLNYRFMDYKLTFRNRPSRNFTGFVDLERENREDTHLGYNDYVRNKIKLRTRYKVNDRLRVRTVLSRWIRDYPNAFAYDNPYKGRKKYYQTEFVVKLEFEKSKQFSYLFEINHVDQNTTDLRYQYERTRIMGGIAYTFE